MSADWYRQRLGNGGPPRQLPPRAVPKFQMGPDGRVYEITEEPPGSVQPMEANGYPYGAPPQPGWQPPGASMPSQVAAPMGQTHAGEAVRYWRGSAEAQTGSSGCPRCGSPNYFPTMTAGLQDGAAGESGKLSMGHCMMCGYRNSSGRSYAATPSAQPAGIRGIRSEEIPTYAARSPHMPEFKGFEVVARVN